MLTDKIQKQALTHLEDKTGCNDWVLSGLSVTARQYKLSGTYSIHKIF